MRPTAVVNTCTLQSTQMTPAPPPRPPPPSFDTKPFPPPPHPPHLPPRTFPVHPKPIPTPPLPDLHPYKMECMALKHPGRTSHIAIVATELIVWLGNGLLTVSVSKTASKHSKKHWVFSGDGIKVPEEILSFSDNGIKAFEEILSISDDGKYFKRH